jgi:hypothetical protein
MLFPVGVYAAERPFWEGPQVLSTPRPPIQTKLLYQSEDGVTPER